MRRTNLGAACALTGASWWVLITLGQSSFGEYASEVVSYGRQQGGPPPVAIMMTSPREFKYIEIIIKSERARSSLGIPASALEDCRRLAQRIEDRPPDLTGSMSSGLTKEATSFLSADQKRSLAGCTFAKESLLALRHEFVREVVGVSDQAFARIKGRISEFEERNLPWKCELAYESERSESDDKRRMKAGHRLMVEGGDCEKDIWKELLSQSSRDAIMGLPRFSCETQDLWKVTTKAR